jgi:hypothetical protein
MTKALAGLMWGSTRLNTATPAAHLLLCTHNCCDGSDVQVRSRRDGLICPPFERESLESWLAVPLTPYKHSLQNAAGFACETMRATLS